jgi:Mannosyltransferase (PIG-V)
MWRRVLVLWSASRAAIIGLGVLVTSELAWHRPIEPWQTQPWQALTGWDSVYYIRISQDGYSPGPTNAFFPLYPLLIRIFREVTGLSDAVSALAVANGAALLALAGLAVLARDRLGDAMSRWGPIYLVLSPFAFALSLAYSDGVFLALAIWLFVAADRNRVLAVAVLGLLAGLSRINGVTLVAPLLWMAWKRRSRTLAAAAFAPLAGLGLFMALLRHEVGDSLAMVHVQKEWGGAPTFPPFALIDELSRFSTDHQPIHLLSFVVLVAYLSLLVPLVRSPVFAEHRWEDVLYVAGVFLLPLTSGILQSSGRFGLLAFPVFLVLADLGLRHRTFHRAYMVFAPTAQIVLFSYVALGYLVP